MNFSYPTLYGHNFFEGKTEKLNLIINNNNSLLLRINHISIES